MSSGESSPAAVRACSRPGACSCAPWHRAGSVVHGPRPGSDALLRGSPRLPPRHSGRLVTSFMQSKSRFLSGRKSDLSRLHQKLLKKNRRSEKSVNVYSRGINPKAVTVILNKVNPRRAEIASSQKTYHHRVKKALKKKKKKKKKKSTNKSCLVDPISYHVHDLYMTAIIHNKLQGGVNPKGPSLSLPF